MHHVENLTLLTAWLAALWRASWQGGLALLLVWGITQYGRRLPPVACCWLWRLAFLKLFLALCLATPLTLRVFPASVQTYVAPVTTAATPAPAADAAPVASPTHPASASASLPPAHHPAAVPGWGARIRLLVLPVLAALWGLGVAWGLVRLLIAWRRTRRLWRASTPVTEDARWGVLVETARQMRVTWPPALRVSEMDGPCVVGLWQPTIIIPRVVLDSDDTATLRMIFAHELAHVRGHDIVWGWLSIIAETLFFFHPLVRPATRAWQEAQEMACDAQALAVMQAPAQAYGAMLVTLAGRRRRHP